jgi:acyl-CoA thioester hydrolase
MQSFVTPVHIRWADIDPNFHARHSVYYDWTATSRLDFLVAEGLTTERMQALHFGPILFREECIFRREIRLGDPVTITLELIKARRDYSRWTIRHHIMKNPETVSAILTVDGAWLDTAIRKLVVPPDEAKNVFSKMPRPEEFQWTEEG